MNMADFSLETISKLKRAPSYKYHMQTNMRACANVQPHSLTHFTSVLKSTGCKV